MARTVFLPTVQFCSPVCRLSSYLFTTPVSSVPHCSFWILPIILQDKLEREEGCEPHTEHRSLLPLFASESSASTSHACQYLLPHWELGLCSEAAPDTFWGSLLFEQKGKYACTTWLESPGWPSPCCCPPHQTQNWASPGGWELSQLKWIH